MIDNSSPDECSFSNEPINFTDHIESEWAHIQFLGQGGYGSVYKAKKLNGLIGGNKVEMCAIKKVPNNVFHGQEVKILEKLKENEYSMEYYGCGEDKDFKYIYIGCIDGAQSVKDILLKTKNNRLEEAEILQLLKEVVVALQSIHSHRIIHRDIKEEHILCIHDDQGNRIGIKIIDFGVSKQCVDGTKFKSFAGTESYMAPEVKLQNNKASRKSDVYSLGCTLIKMADSSKPLQVDDSGIPIIPAHLSWYLKNIIQRCIITNLEARFDIYGLHKHLFGSLSSDMECLSIKGNNGNKAIVLGSLDSLGSIPNDVTNLSLPSFDSEIGVDKIPKSVTHLSFKVFNQEIGHEDIPPTVKYLDLGDEFDIQSNGDNIPADSITTLKCGFKFTKIINQKSFPSSVTDLQLTNYNLKLTSNSIPKSVTYLTLGSNFDHIESLTHLPPTIINLTFRTDIKDVTIINNILSRKNKINNINNN